MGRQDPLEERAETHSSILPGESHGQRSPLGSGPGVAESDMTECVSVMKGYVSGQIYLVF